MSPPESFPERLKAYRMSMGWTQEELANEWTYSFETISAWERGKRNPRSQQIPRLARLLSMEPEELVQCINATRVKMDAHRRQENPSDAMKKAWVSALETWGEVQHIYRTRTELSRDFSYPRMFEEAHEILAVGISLNAIAMNYSREKIIRSIIEKKSTFTLCFLDPDGVCCAEREREEGYIQGPLAELTRLNISTMKNIRNAISRINLDCTKQLQIMIYDLLPRFNMYVVDDALMTMQPYAYDRGEDTPTFVLKRQSRSGLFDFFASAARHILEQAKPINM